MSSTTRLWLVVLPAALAVGVAASTLMAVSDFQDVPGLQAAMTALTGWSFIVAGLIARTRRPQNRTGLLLIAVGFTWLISMGLISANDSLAFSLGVAFLATPAGFLVHLLLAYPSGRLGSRWDRAVVVAGYVLVTVGQVATMPLEPEPGACAECPENAFLVSDSETAAVALEAVVQSCAVVLLLAVVATLIRRWQNASPAARRTLTPVLLAGGATLFFFAVSVGLHSLSRTASEVAGWVAMVLVIAVPFVFLWGLLQSRLARAEIGRVLTERPGGAVQERVRQLLRDPTAEVLYRRAEPERAWVDVAGRPREPEAAPGRAITPVERAGRPLAAILHDEALLEERELLEQVAAAVALEVERDTNLFALEASDRRNRALLRAIPDKMFRLSADGTILDIQDNASWPSPAGVQVGSSVYEGRAPRDATDLVMETGRRALVTGELQTAEWQIDIGGDVYHAEGRFIPSGKDEFYVVIRDVTDRKRREEEQAALHRVALAVATGGKAERILDLVAEEIGRVLGADSANLIRFEPGGTEAVVVGGWNVEGAYALPIGERYSLEGTAGAVVLETGRPARFEADDEDASDWVREHMREGGIRSLVVAPITVAGRPWGAVGATLRAPRSFAPAAEERLGAFTQIVSLALANEEARQELAASRARLVSAGDEERRRLERNLHDGAQQRLVSVSVALRLAQKRLGTGPDAAEELLAAANRELAVALEELRELARGIHPAVLTERGLGPALASLADRSPVPVDLDVGPDERLPDSVEAATYYVVSEALTNVAKYAGASAVSVRVVEEDGFVVVEVADDGVGGAEPDRGSGLRGLADRVEALDGHLQIDSPLGKGTTVRAELPVRLATLEDTGQPHVREAAPMPALDA